MKKIKKIFAFFLTLICLNLCFVEGIAAGPLDGQVIDGRSYRDAGPAPCRYCDGQRKSI